MANYSNHLGLRRRSCLILGCLAIICGMAQSVIGEVAVAPADWLSVPEWTEQTTALGEAKALRSWLMAGALGVWASFGAILWRSMTARVRI